jgi:hypothetical protein
LNYEERGRFQGDILPLRLIIRDSLGRLF